MAVSRGSGWTSSTNCAARSKSCRDWDGLRASGPLSLKPCPSIARTAGSLPCLRGRVGVGAPPKLIGEAAIVSLGTALRLAGRELRGGLRGFRVFLACLVLGVGAIAAIGSLRAAVETGLRTDAALLLGGDVSARLTLRPASAAERDFLARSGTLSETASLRAMARSLDGKRRSLIDLRAVDAAYPLYGTVTLSPAAPLGSARSSNIWHSMTACSAPSCNRPPQPGSGCGPATGSASARRFPPDGADRACARRRVWRLVVRSARDYRRAGAGRDRIAASRGAGQLRVPDQTARNANATPLPGSNGPAPNFPTPAGSCAAAPTLRRRSKAARPARVFSRPRRHHRAPRRRRRDRQCGRRLCREQDRGDRDPEMSRRLDRPGLHRLFAADPGARRGRRRARPDARRRRAALRCAAARRPVAGLAAVRSVLGAPRVCGGLRLLGDARLYTVAARRDRPRPARRAVAGPGVPGAAPSRAAGGRRDDDRRLGACGGDRAERAGAPVRAVVSGGALAAFPLFRLPRGW